MNKVIVRRVKIEELKRVSYITKLAWKIPYDRSGLVNEFRENKKLQELFLNNKIKILVAIIKDKIIGAIRYEFPRKDQIYFSKLAVLPGRRNKGIGSALLNKLEIVAKKSGVKEIFLDVMEEKFLKRYYQKFGYKVIKRVKHLDHHDIYMSKIL